jgi:transcriptional regulator with XRE-family HTH domain
MHLAGPGPTTLREREGLKQIELATAAGMTESQISDIERGKNNPADRLSLCETMP